MQEDEATLTLLKLPMVLSIKGSLLFITHISYG